MPDASVKTLRDLIWYQYAKIIARSAFKVGNGKAAKAEHYGFIKNTLRDLRSGVKKWSDITREDWQLVDAEKKCAYCGSTADLAHEHIVPKSLLINDRCPACDTIQSIHNQIWVCKSCNSAKGTTGLYAFFKSRMPDNGKFYDFIPPLLEKKYLKTVYDCLICADCLNSGDLDGDGELTVLDIDYALKVHGHLG